MVRAPADSSFTHGGRRKEGLLFGLGVAGEAAAKFTKVFWFFFQKRTSFYGPVAG
jgi:hypothetical protein